MSSPSPIPSLRGLLERTVTVADIVTGPLWSVEPGQAAADAASVLKAREFDLAGVVEDPVSRYVTLRDLTAASGTVDEIARPILATETVERTLPLADLVAILKHREYVFILDHDHVNSVATRADLQAPAVTVVVLSYLVAIEAGLAMLIPRELGDQWFDLLPTQSKRIALDLYEQKRSRNVAIGLEDCLYFKDWFHLMGRSKPLMMELGFPSRSAFVKKTGSFANMRNDLAHGGTLLDAVTPAQAIDRFSRVRELADAIWELIEHRSERWDVYASTIITFPDGSPVLSKADPLLVSRPAHIVTAWNPGSVTRSKNANAGVKRACLYRA